MTTPRDEPMTKQQRRILAAVLVPVFMTLLAVSSINVVLPTLQQSIDATDSQLQWVLSGYTLVFGALLVPAGRAGDALGRGRLFVLGLTLFGLGSLLSGLATSGELLVASRFLMGAGSGLLNPQPIGMIQQYFEGRRRARAFASFGAAVGLSVAIGPIMGGAFVEFSGPDWGWRLSLLVNVPIALLAIGLAWWWFPRQTFARRPEGSRVDLDPVGTLLFTAAVLLFMLPFLERSAGPRIFLLVPVGLALVGLWLAWERRHERSGGIPMVDLGLFRVRSYALGVLLIALQFLGVTSVWVVLALYLQNGLGASALAVGLAGLPSAVATGLCSTWSGRVVLEMGRKVVALGIVLVLVSVLSSIAVVWAHHTHGVSPWWLAATLTLLGAGQGMVVSPNQTLSLMAVPHQRSGAAGALIQTGQRVGTAVGIAFITAVFFVLQPQIGWDGAFMVAYGVIAAIVVASLLVALLDVRLARRD